MSMAQDFLDKLQAGTIETKAADESIDFWTKLQAIMEDGARKLSEDEEQKEVKPQPVLGNMTPMLAPALPMSKILRQTPVQQQPVQQTPAQPPPAEPSEAPTPEDIEKYKTTIDKIFNVKHFGKLVAPSIRNSIRKVLKEQLPNLDYKNMEFIEKFEEANGQVTKVASKVAGEFEGILREYKAAVQGIAGVEVESILTEE